MAVLDGPLGSVAKTLTKTFGRSATITRPGSGGSYDPASGDITGAGSTTTTSCSIVFDESAVHLFDEALVRQGDRAGIVARTELGFQPNPGEDTLTEGGRDWEIADVKLYSSGAQEAAYALLLRR